MQDYWETHIVTDNGKFLSGMYYYLIRPQDITNVSPVLGNCNAIHSAWWSPILDETLLLTDSVKYDTERFGKLNNGSIGTAPILQRIKTVKNYNVKLGDVTTYTPYNRISFRHYSNESRLLNYPYSYGLITDFMNIPIEVKFHEVLSINNKFSVHAKAFLSDKGTYSIYIENLKGDYKGSMEANINTAPLEVPVSSSAYSSWSSTQKAQDNQNVRNAIMNSNVGMLSSGVNAVGSALNMDINGTLQSGINIYTSYMQKQQAIGMKNAHQKDLQNTPRTMISTGSDVGFSMINGGKKISFFRYTISDEYKEILTDFFTMYGYKQNKLLKPYLRSRYYFNFIKTNGANIRAWGNGIPKEHLKELMAIFDRGTTIWHVDRKNVEMFNYEKDNYELFVNNKLEEKEKINSWN